MKLPIVEPEMVFGMERYSIRREYWGCWRERLERHGFTFELESKQYLEDCIEDTTQLIAEQGQLSFKNLQLEFVAQLDIAGFALYLGDEVNEAKKSQEIVSIIKNEI